MVDAVPIGATARWLTSSGEVWEWDGTGHATRLRATCDHPLRLAPDGTRVACARGHRIVIDSGRGELAGPAGEQAVWSRDGRSLYVTSAGLVRRWIVDGKQPPDVVAAGFDPSEVGSWLVAKNHSELVRVWIGSGPPPGYRCSISVDGPRPRPWSIRCPRIGW